MQLEFLVLQMKYSGSTSYAGMLTAASAVADMLRPACETLLSLSQELAEADVFPPYPILQCLHLYEIGVCPDVFRQLRPHGLRQLHVTMRETETPSARDWVEIMEDILASIKLNELARDVTCVIRHPD
jgi:hypothetical protein